MTVTDTLPPGLTASSSSANCSGSATVSCTIASLPDNTDTTETISATPTSTGTMTNTVDASGLTLNSGTTFTTAAAPPISATTDPPASLGATTATLAGTIDPEGRTVTYFFRYAKTNGYDQSTPAQTLGPDSASHAVGADVTGLTPNTTYHYQLVVNNGEAGGADRQLTTSSPAPVTGSVSLVAVSQLNELVTGD